MQIMFKNLVLLVTALISTVACADTANKSLDPAAKHPPSTQSEERSYDEWKRALGINDKSCSATFDGNAKRFVSLLRLTNDAQLLALTCELGAYQDGKRLYILRDESTTPLTPVLPAFEKTWVFSKQEIVWGGRYVEDDYLVLENWYAGSGECGYRALYLIEQVINEPSPQPQKVFGDANCEDGVFIDDWPVIVEK